MDHFEKKNNFIIFFLSEDGEEEFLFVLYLRIFLLWLNPLYFQPWSSILHNIQLSFSVVLSGVLVICFTGPLCAKMEDLNRIHRRLVEHKLNPRTNTLQEQKENVQVPKEWTDTLNVYLDSTQGKKNTAQIPDWSPYIRCLKWGEPL